MMETEEIAVTSNENVEEKKSTRKKHCCFYCTKYFTNIAQHLERKHSDEDEVKEFMVLPQGSSERKEIINIIRKRGNFESAIFNQKIIPSRISKKNEEDCFKFCPKCKGAYSKDSLRKHYKKCANETLNPNNNRGLMVLSRKIYTGLHSTASEALKSVFSRLRDKDNVVRVTKSDFLIISYGNKLCCKLKDPHHYPEIRAKIRILGRFLIKMRLKAKEVTNLASVYQPCHYRHALQVVNEMANLNDDLQTYENPNVATSLGTLLKKVGKHLKSVFIEKGKKDLIPDVEDFLHLLNEDYSTSINKTAYESNLKFKRSKNIELPSHEDIRRLYNYVCQERKNMYKEIKNNGYKLELWTNLSELTLISLQVFNRRRSGESERLKIEDVKNYHKLDWSKDKEIFMSLDLSEKDAAEKYLMIRLRGKLGREVNIIADKSLYKCLKMIINHRKEAGVLKDNPYVFGLKSNIDDNEHRHLSACALLRKYSILCGAKNPALLRGTLLRKHMATQAAVLGLSESDVTDLANHLGHQEKIHKEYYRLPVATREITQMSRLLNTCLEARDTINLNENKSLSDNVNNLSPQVSSPSFSPISIEGIIESLNETDKSVSTSADKEDDHRVNSCSDEKSKDIEKISTEDDHLVNSCSDEKCKDTEKNSTEDDHPVNRCSNEKSKELRILLTPIKIVTGTAEGLNDACTSPKVGVLLEDPSASVSTVLYDQPSPYSASSSDVWTPERDLKRHRYSKYEYNLSGESETENEKCFNKQNKDKPNKDKQNKDKQNKDKQNKKTIEIESLKKIKRRTWTTPEKKMARYLFQSYLHKKQLPPFKAVKEAVQKYPDLQNRTAKQLYTWLSNLNKKGIEKSEITKNISGIKRMTWTTPEKELVRHFFGAFLKSGRLPPFRQCQVVTQQCKQLKGRTAEQLYAYINNTIKKKKEKSVSPSDKYKIDIGSPAKHVVRRLFSDYIDEGKIPDDEKCAEAIIKNSPLKKATIKKIEHFVEFEIKRKKFKQNVQQE